MSKELGFVLMTPYSLRKSRTGGIIGRLLSLTGLELVASRMFGPSNELVQKYAELVRGNEDISPEMRELLTEYLIRELTPFPDGRCHRVMMLLFEGEDAVSKLYQAAGSFIDSQESADTVRGTYGDFVHDNQGNVTYFEPAILIGPTIRSVKNTLGLWAEYAASDGGLLERAVRIDGGPVEKTLVIIKPDNFTFPSARPGNVIDTFSRSGLRIIAAKLHRMSLAEALEFYGPVQQVLREKLSGYASDRACQALEKEFEFEMPDDVRDALGQTLGPAFGDQQFYSIMHFMTGHWAPDASKEDTVSEGRERCLALIYAGEDAVEKIRNILGPTDPRKATPGSVRKEFGTDVMVNAAHASDSPESVEREMGIINVESDTISRWYEQYYA